MVLADRSTANIDILVERQIIDIEIAAATVHPTQGTRRNEVKVTERLSLVKR